MGDELMVPSKETICRAVLDRYKKETDRERALARTLQLRTDMLLARTRLVKTYAELGSYFYGRTKGDRAKNKMGDEGVERFITRIDGIRTELSGLQVLMQQALGAQEV